MKAVVLRGITSAQQVRLEDVKIPSVKSGWVLVKVMAFGLNHSEQILRLSEANASYIKKPIILGIECVGEIANSSDSGFKVGQKVIAFMGGMGRSFNGSYAEYALLPVANVFTINSTLPWQELAAVPETYFTAWGSLFEGLMLTPNDKLLVRGATCALGYAATQIAKALGCKVVATTHRSSKLPLLKESDIAVLDTGELDINLSGITKVLELVGPKTLRDSLKIVKKGGIVCNTGVLGGVYTLNNFDPIKEIPNGVFLTSFFSNYPTQKVVNDIFSYLNKHKIKPHVAQVFDFKDIQKACIAQDLGNANGKIVVKM